LPRRCRYADYDVDAFISLRRHYADGALFDLLRRVIAREERDVYMALMSAQMRYVTEREQMRLRRLFISLPDGCRHCALMPTLLTLRLIRL